MSYDVIGKFTQEELKKHLSKKTTNNKVMKSLIASSLVIICVGFVSTFAEAATVNPISDTADPVKLDSINNFISWIQDLSKYVFGIVAGLLVTFAGLKLAFDLSGSGGQTEAKKIIKNVIVGGLIIWASYGMTNIFTNKLNVIFG